MNTLLTHSHILMNPEDVRNCWKFIVVVHLAKYFDLCVNDGNHLVMYYVMYFNFLSIFWFKINPLEFVVILGSKFLKCTKILSPRQPFLYFSPSLFLPFKDEYDGITNCSGLKYGTHEIFNIFWLVSFDRDQNIVEKNYNKD